MDAYTLRKIAPRILIGAIGINLSIYLCFIAIDVVNVIGNGLYSLIVSPFDYSAFREADPSLGKGVKGAGILFWSGLVIGGLATAVAVGLAGFFMLILWIILWYLVILAILVFRQGLLLFLTVISPIAFALWILPNTEKYFRQWWEWFIKALLVYPIITALFAVSNALSTFYAVQSEAGDERQNINLIVGAIVAIAPLMLIPFAFRFAGGALSFASNFGTQMASRGGAFARGFARKQTAKNWEGVKSGTRFKGLKGGQGAIARRANRALQTGALASREAGINPFMWRANVQSARSRFGSVGSAAMQQDQDYTWQNDDDLNKAAAKTTNKAELMSYMRTNMADRYTDASGAFDENKMRQDVSRIETMRGKYGNGAMRQTAWQKALAGGSAYTDNAEWLQDAASIAGNDEATLANMIGAGRGAAMGGGRVDQGAVSFGTAHRLAQDFRDNPAATPQEGQDKLESAGQAVSADIMAENGAGVIAHGSMKKKAVENMSEHLRDEFQTALQSGDQDKITSELAKVSAIHDAMGQSSPSNAEAFRNIVMENEGNGYGAQGESVFSMVEDHLKNPNTKDALENKQMGYRQTIQKVGAKIDAQQQQAAAQNQAAAQAAQAGQPPGGGPAGPPNAPPPAPSDRRFKRNIKHIYTAQGRIKIYSFQYNWSDQFYIGVMAQDLLESHPEAIYTDSRGYYYVDYPAIGVSLRKIEQI